MAAFPPLPWRKADIEYHNSRHVARLAERFDAEAFAEQLVKARVNGATVFAKDMYGYFYYPNAHGPVHPGLSFDLFGAQVAALRKRKIHVLAYYMTTCNPVLANRHPEWLIVRDRAAAQASEHERAFTGDYQPAGAGAGAPQPAAQRDTAQDEDKEYEIWKWKFCLANEAYVQWDLACIRELVSRYEIDALWLDQAHARACFCPDCLRHLREQGLDPFDNGVQHRHKVAIKNAFLKRIQQVVKETRPACLVCPQCEASFGMTERAPLMDYSDIEVLPTDDVHYGYDYCATMLRFQRGHGVPTYGLTTRFKGYWADFGGLKLPAQLQLEAATFVANGARCNIGDQLHPNGRLDPAVYHVIGKVYRHIEKIEPYLEQAVPVTEAALVITGPTLGRPRGAVNYGWVKLLVESRMQFDVVEPDTPWERYGLILLPEDLPVEKAMATRLQAFIAGGGAVIAAHNAGLVAGTERSWLARYGLRYAGPSPFEPAYMVPKVSLNGGIPAYEYALYEGASQWRAKAPATSLAALGEPLFQRSPHRFTSHLQTPFGRTTSYAAVARSGRVGLIAFPLGRSYYNQGYWIYRNAFQKLLGEVLPVPLVRSDAPLNTEITLTHQAPRPDIGRQARYMVHIVNFSSVRRTPKHPDFYEDPIPLTNVALRVNLPLKAGTARAVVAGTDLPARRVKGGVEVVVPSVRVHEVVSFEGL